MKTTSKNILFRYDIGKENYFFFSVMTSELGLNKILEKKNRKKSPFVSQLKTRFKAWRTFFVMKLLTKFFFSNDQTPYGFSNERTF